jgi:hypothetical protein
MTRTARPKKFGLEMMASLVTAWRAGGDTAGFRRQGSGETAESTQQETGNRKQEAGSRNCLRGTGESRGEAARLIRRNTRPGGAEGKRGLAMSAKTSE